MLQQQQQQVVRQMLPRLQPCLSLSVRCQVQLGCWSGNCQQLLQQLALLHVKQQRSQCLGGSLHMHPQLALMQQQMSCMLMLEQL
jgi:hypothetical protein